MIRRQTAAVGQHPSHACRRQQRAMRGSAGLSALPMLLLITLVQQASAQSLSAADTAKLAAVQAACTTSYSCGDFTSSATPFAVSAPSYDSTTGRLCYAVTAKAPCTKCSTKSCAATTGISALYHRVADWTLKPTLGAGTTLKPVGGSGAARIGGPACVQKYGGVTVVSVGAGASGSTGLLLKKGTGPANVCLQYPAGTPFRRVGQVSGAGLQLPAAQACCAVALQYKPETATLSVWTRGAGPTFGAGLAGCQACTTMKVSTTKGKITGRVYLDSNADNVVTPGIDEGFEGIVVNVFRVAGTARTFLGCAQTDATGAYTFASLIPDTYTVQVVLPTAGAGQAMRFAQRRVGRGVSNVSSAGQSYVLNIAGASVGIDALIQIVALNTAR